MTKLHRLHDEHDQTPWLDNISRAHLRHNALARMVGEGIRGVTANPTILARSIERSNDYDGKLSSLVADGCSVVDAFWELVVSDIVDALAVLRPVFDSSGAGDGFVSLEVAPELAHDSEATVLAARALEAAGTLGQTRLPAVHRALLRATVAGPGPARRTPPAAIVGVDVDEEPRLSGHTVRRQPHRAWHGEHPA